MRRDSLVLLLPVLFSVSLALPWSWLHRWWWCVEELIWTTGKKYNQESGWMVSFPSSYCSLPLPFSKCFIFAPFCFPFFLSFSSPLLHNLIKNFHVGFRPFHLFASQQSAMVKEQETGGKEQGGGRRRNPIKDLDVCVCFLLFPSSCSLSLLLLLSLPSCLLFLASSFLTVFIMKSASRIECMRASTNFPRFFLLLFPSLSSLPSSSSCPFSSSPFQVVNDDDDCCVPLRGERHSSECMAHSSSCHSLSSLSLFSFFFFFSFLLTLHLFRLWMITWANKGDLASTGTKLCLQLWRLCGMAETKWNSKTYESEAESQREKEKDEEEE